MSKRAISMVFYPENTVVTLENGEELIVYPETALGKRLNINDFRDIFFPHTQDDMYFNEVGHDD